MTPKETKQFIAKCKKVDDLAQAFMRGAEVEAYGVGANLEPSYLKVRLSDGRLMWVLPIGNSLDIHEERGRRETPKNEHGEETTRP